MLLYNKVIIYTHPSSYGIATYLTLITEYLIRTRMILIRSSVLTTCRPEHSRQGKNVKCALKYVASPTLYNIDYSAKLRFVFEQITHTYVGEE